MTHKIECKVCSKTFKAARKYYRYCSTLCKTRYYKEMYRVSSKRWRERNADYDKQRKKPRNAEDKDKLSKRHKAWYASRGKALLIAKKYGLTAEAHKKLLKAQKNKCAIKGCRRKSLVIDHCHKTGKVRGILCAPHNTAIGLMGDDLNGVLLVAKYLEKFS